MKKLVRYFGLLLFSAFFMFCFSSKQVNANYDNSKNSVFIVAGAKAQKTAMGDTEHALELRITIKYQRGFDKEATEYRVCKISDGVVPLFENCNEITGKVVKEGSVSDYIAKAPASEADSNLTSKSFNITTSKTFDYTAREDRYIVMVKTVFCAVRQPSEQGFQQCQYFHDSSKDENKGITTMQFKVKDILAINISEIQDEEIKNMIEQITEIVATIVMPVIYVLLGIFFVIKGAILGIQIVKSSDDPQVRQEKIGALKWLVIGVAISYAVSGAIHAITGFLSGTFNLS